MATLVSCGGKVQESIEASKHLTAQDAVVVLTEEPDGVLDVIDMKQKVKNGDEVVVFGRARVFNKGLSQMVLTGTAVKHCAERPGDTCETPWDYCCEESSDVNAHSISVEVHEDGRPLKESLEGFAGLKLLSDVVVKGRAEKDDSGNVRVVASAIYLRP